MSFMALHRKDGEAMTEVQDSGGLKNTQVHNLAAAATQLLDRAAAAPAGRAALTLVPGAGAPLKRTLLAFRGGVQLAEHDAPGAATLQVLHGRVRLVTSQASRELGQSDHRTHQRLCVSSLKERGRSIPTKQMVSVLCAIPSVTGGRPAARPRGQRGGARSAARTNDLGPSRAAGRWRGEGALPELLGLLQWMVEGCSSIASNRWPRQPELGCRSSVRRAGRHGAVRP